MTIHSQLWYEVAYNKYNFINKTKYNVFIENFAYVKRKKIYTSSSLGINDALIASVISFIISGCSIR